jgi:hypothetical protein
MNPPIHHNDPRRRGHGVIAAIGHTAALTSPEARARTITSSR